MNRFSSLFIAVAISLNFLASGEEGKSASSGNVTNIVDLQWEQGRVFDLTFSSSYGLDVEEKTRMSNGSVVKKGDALISVNSEALQASLDMFANEVNVARLALENAQFAKDEGERVNKEKIAQSQLNLARMQEDLDDYVKILYPALIRESEWAVKKAEFNVAYRKENLSQLEKMYKEDNLTEENEEIILFRTRNELADGNLALEIAKRNHQLKIDKKFPREKADKELAVEIAKKAHEDLVKKLTLEQKGRELAILPARKKLTEVEKKQAAAMKEAEKLKFEAPADGVLMWCTPERKGAINAAFILLPEDKKLSVPLKKDHSVETKYRIKTNKGAIMVPSEYVGKGEGDVSIIAIP